MKPREWTRESWELEVKRFEKFLKDTFDPDGKYIITHDGPIHGGTGICGRPETWKEY